MISGIFLAAGRSTRFGKRKLMLEVDGKPLYYYGLRNCVESRLMRVIVVLGDGSEELRESIALLFGGTEKISIVENSDFELGMMLSLKKGLGSLGSDCRGAMVLLADMPLVTADIIDRLLAAFEKEERIIVPECRGDQYHPRIIPAGLFPEFLRLGDDEKGTKVLDEYSEEIVRVMVGRRINYMDIDRAEDLDSIRGLMEADPQRRNRAQRRPRSEEDTSCLDAQEKPGKLHPESA